jgi:hypothetical protein
LKEFRQLLLRPSFGAAAELLLYYLALALPYAVVAVVGRVAPEGGDRRVKVY